MPSATKLIEALPWLVRYPWWRARDYIQRFTEPDRSLHLIVVIANHFEPGWNENGQVLSWPAQLRRVEAWSEQARAIGEVLRDDEGSPYRHTYFFPAEQYHPTLLERLAELQRGGLGEVEVHLHHGVDRPDTESNLRRVLTWFRDTLAEEHGCLARENGVGMPRYAFVHGNLALANSRGGDCCGVDSEMQILAETGCYADLSMPTAPLCSQVGPINAIYACARPLHERVPHRRGRELRVGSPPMLPVLLTGPLILYRRRTAPFFHVGIDGGALSPDNPLDIERFHRWTSAPVRVAGRPEWRFLKLYCHGFFPGEREWTLGEPMRRFWSEVLDLGRRTGAFQLHFATAREAFNIAMAAVDGCGGHPGRYRNYRLQAMGMQQPIKSESLTLTSRRT